MMTYEWCTHNGTTGFNIGLKVGFKDILLTFYPFIVKELTHRLLSGDSWTSHK